MDIQSRNRNFMLRNIGIFLLILVTAIVTTEEKLSVPILLDALIGISTTLLIVYINNLILLPQYLAKRNFFLYGVFFIPFLFISAFTHQIISNLSDQNLLNGKGQMQYWDAFGATLFFLVVGSMLKITYSWFLVNQKLSKEENHRLKTELELLRLQINPHFFFNTLNNLYGLSIENSPKVPQAILKLSELMRYVLYDSNATSVTIEKEVAYLQNYIELQKLRITNIDIVQSYNIADNNLHLSPHLFISLIENAFKHGADSGVNNPFIHLKLETNGHDLYFQMSNNYDNDAYMSEEKSKGIGLTNLKRHLEIAYPHNHTLTIRRDQAIFEVILTINFIL